MAALGTCAGLAGDHAWDSALIATIVVCLAIGVAQARRMTRMRAGALTSPENPHLTARVRRGARTAALLRTGIALLSLALIALGSVLAT